MEDSQNLQTRKLLICCDRRMWYKTYFHVVFIYSPSDQQTDVLVTFRSLLYKKKKRELRKKKTEVFVNAGVFRVQKMKQVNSEIKDFEEINNRKSKSVE